MSSQKSVSAKDIKYIYIYSGFYCYWWSVLFQITCIRIHRKWCMNVHWLVHYYCSQFPSAASLLNSIQLLNYRLAFIVKQPQEKTEGSLQQQRVGKRLQRRVGQQNIKLTGYYGNGDDKGLLTQTTMFPRNVIKCCCAYRSNPLP